MQKKTFPWEINTIIHIVTQMQITTSYGAFPVESVKSVTNIRKNRGAVCSKNRLVPPVSPVFQYATLYSVTFPVEDDTRS